VENRRAPSCSAAAGFRQHMRGSSMPYTPTAPIWTTGIDGDGTSGIGHHPGRAEPGEAHGLGGKDAITAIVAGYDVYVRWVTLCCLPIFCGGSQYRHNRSRGGRSRFGKNPGPDRRRRTPLHKPRGGSSLRVT